MGESNSKKRASRFSLSTMISPLETYPSLLVARMLARALSACNRVRTSMGLGSSEIGLPHGRPIVSMRPGSQGNMSADRRGVLQAALGPQRVQPAVELQRRVLADIALEHLAVIA